MATEEKPTGKAKANSESDNKSDVSPKRKSGKANSSASTAKKSSSKNTGTQKSNGKNQTSQKEATSSSWMDRLSDLGFSAFKIAKRTTDSSFRVGKTLINSQEQIKLMMAAGESLKDLREVAGLTINELSDAINLKDKTVLEAVENGAATLSFELILILAALLARNDPVPFIIKYTRTYNPELWKFLDDWGLGRLPLHYERERQFINIYRRHDAARQLSDEGFDSVLDFTQQAFEMALHFIAENEHVNVDEQTTSDEIDDTETNNKDKSKQKSDGKKASSKLQDQ